MSRVMAVLLRVRGQRALSAGCRGKTAACSGRHRPGETLPHAPPDRWIPPGAASGVEVRAPPGGSPPVRWDPRGSHRDVRTDVRTLRTVDPATDRTSLLTF